VWRNKHGLGSLVLGSSYLVRADSATDRLVNNHDACMTYSEVSQCLFVVS
jgi:hypothetical protein